MDNVPTTSVGASRMMDVKQEFLLESHRRRKEREAQFLSMQQQQQRFVKTEMNPDAFAMMEPFVQLTVKQERYSWKDK